MTKVVKIEQSRKNNLCYFNYLTNPSGIFEAQKLAPKKHIFSNLPYLTSQCGIEIYENLVKLKLGTRSRPEKEPPVRKMNDITKFSQNSRRRMIRKLSTISLESYQTPIFLTLTFHNSFPSKSEELKNVLRNYLKRLNKYDPKISQVWRLEWQKRKAPHFHLIVFPPIKYNQYQIEKLQRELKLWWFSYLPDHDYHTWKYSVNIQTIKEKKKLFHYISKYSAKEEEVSEVKFIGQRHGASRNLITEPSESFATSQEFMMLLKKKIWKYISPKFREPQEFQKCFFDTGEVSFILSSEEMVAILNQTLAELENT